MSSAIIGEGIYRAMFDGSGAARGYNQFRSGIESGNQRITRSFSSVEGSVSRVVAALGAAQLGRNILNLGMRFDSLQKGLTAVVGSAGEATRQLQQMHEVARKPGLTFESVLTASRNMQALGVSVERSLRLTEQLGNASALVGGSSQDMLEVVRQITQMMGSGRAFGDELRIITERIPVMSVALKEAFGTANSQAIAKLGLSTDEFFDRLTRGLSRLPRAAMTTQENWNKMVDSLKASAFEIFQVIQPVVDRVVGKVRDLSDSFNSMPKSLREATVRMATYVAVGAPLMLGLTKMVGMVSSVKRDLAAIEASRGISRIAASQGGGGGLLPYLGAEAALDAFGHRRQTANIASRLGSVFDDPFSMYVMRNQDPTRWVRAGSNVRVADPALLKVLQARHELNVSRVGEEAALAMAASRAGIAAPPIPPSFASKVWAGAKGFLPTGIGLGEGVLGTKIGTGVFRGKLAGSLNSTFASVASKLPSMLGRTIGAGLTAAIVLAATKGIDAAYARLVGRRGPGKDDPGWTPERFRDWINFDPIRTGQAGWDAAKAKFGGYKGIYYSLRQGWFANRYDDLKKDPGYKSVREEVEAKAPGWQQVAERERRKAAAEAADKKAKVEAEKARAEAEKLKALAPDIREWNQKLALSRVTDENKRRLLELEQERNNKLAEFGGKDKGNTGIRRVIWGTYSNEIKQVQKEIADNLKSQQREEKRAAMGVREAVLRRKGDAESLYQAEIKAANARYDAEFEKLEELKAKGTAVQNRLKQAEEERISAIQQAEQRKRESLFRDREDRFFMLEANEDALRRVRRDAANAAFDTDSSIASMNRRPFTARRIGIEQDYVNAISSIDDERKQIQRDRNRLSREIELAEKTPGFNPENLKVMKDVLSGFSQRMDALPSMEKAAGWRRTAAHASLPEEQRQAIEDLFSGMTAGSVGRNEYARLRGRGMGVQEARARADEAAQLRGYDFAEKRDISALDALELSQGQAEAAVADIRARYADLRDRVLEGQRLRDQARVGYTTYDAYWKETIAAGYRAGFNKSDPARVAEEQLASARKTEGYLLQIIRNTQTIAQAADQGGLLLLD